MKGYEYPELENISDKSQFEYLTGIDTPERNLKKPLLGRIAVLYEDCTVIRYTAMVMGISSEIEEIDAGMIVESLPLYNVISKKTPNAKQLADEFDTKLRQLRTSGQLDQILIKYGAKDWNLE